MTSRPDPQRSPARRRRGLRARLWLACLAGVLATTLAIGAVSLAITMAGLVLDPGVLIASLSGACLLGLVVALIAGAWLARNVAGSLARLDAAIGRGQPTAGDEWGEVGDVARRIRALLETHRDLREDEAELEALRVSIGQARDAVERWIRSEQWTLLAPTAGGLKSLAESLDRGIRREMEVRDQNLESARLVHSELGAIIEDTRHAAELAEQGYVDVTALLTTIREIARLAGEIQQAVRTPIPAPRPAASPAPGAAEWRDRAAQAIEELVDVSGESVQRLGEGLVRVREINEQVQVMSNRATLIALNAVVAQPEQGAEGSSVELKQLAREVRWASERVATLSAEIDVAVEAANQRMREVREHVLARLVELPAPPAPAVAETPAASPVIAHWIERLREMVQDATRKGERLASSEEKTASSVQRVSHRLGDEARDLEGLVARLSPTGATVAPARIPPPAAAPARVPPPMAAAPESRPGRPLRLFDPDAPRPADESDAGQEGGA